MHSEWSDDGSWPLSRIAATFARRGYHVVLMSEHSRGFTAAKWDDYRQACADASTDRVVLVPGIEYGDEDNVVHIPVWGQVPFFGDAPQIGDLLKQAAAAGGTAVWAHPWRRAAWQRCEPSWWDYLGAVEVWNRKYDGIAPNPDSLALARQHAAAQFVALDLHTRRQLFPLSLSLAVPGPSASRAAPDCDQVYRALHDGGFAARAFGIALGRLTAGPAAQALRLLEGTRRAAAACCTEPGPWAAGAPGPGGSAAGAGQPAAATVASSPGGLRTVPGVGCRGGCAASRLPGCLSPGRLHGPGCEGSPHGGPGRGHSPPSARPATVRC